MEDVCLFIFPAVYWRLFTLAQIQCANVESSAERRVEAYEWHFYTPSKMDDSATSQEVA